MKRPTRVLLLAIIASSAMADAAGLTQEEAVRIALAEDPWLAGSRYTEAALAEEAVAAAALPDPRVELMMANLPTDGFDINQEPMTQASIGVSQMFPRGDSRRLARQQKQQLAGREPLLRTDRQAKVAATVRQLWLEAFKAQETIGLIEQDRTLFEQLVDAAKAGYASAYGRARQQDVIRAQLELTRLEDRLTVLRQQQESAERRLSEWVGAAAARGVDRSLPDLGAAQPDQIVALEPPEQQQEYAGLRAHPAVLALECQIDAMSTGVDLARQKYKPMWGLSARYAYRDDDLSGRDRADFLTLGLSFDLPLFTENRQDREVSAVSSRLEAMKTERVLLLRGLISRLDNARVQLQRLDQRHALYTDTLLPQMAEQAEASLVAYNNDDGDFAEAVRARISELNAKIEALAIAVERQRTLAQIHYLLARTADSDGRPEPCV